MKIQNISKQNFQGSILKNPNKSSLNKLYAAIVPIMMTAPALAQYQDFDSFAYDVRQQNEMVEDNMLKNKIEGEQKTKSTLILGAIAAAVGFLLTVNKKSKEI